MEEIIYPIRINRYLALKNVCSRREADTLIEKGVVLINGKKAKIGDKVNENDKVTVNSKATDVMKKYVYFAFNKPRGIVTHSPKDGQRSIKDITYTADDVFPVGRLDKNSRGLLILTNDGRINDKLLNPEYNHEKEYVVTVNKPITNIFLKVMRQGVQLEDFKTREAVVEKKDETTFNIILTEGKKHQIRRMCTALGWEVVDLKRIRVMGIKLGTLGSGQQRKLQGKELEDLLASLGVLQ
ncbi:MAG: Ribosomal large subunit pseudouridine synthase F [Candidatus Moranbacteria bacterium GW2011_GWE1_36_7]|nr:MAG: Ribosomal large subunit pseudouridine synthase F [Candidatus Moranbacteria bacterium GW2011_GWD2_36_12]KKQ06179.1 MAG: Ribosomal large subunit pseudouridine synthase F [Candidatus Moranbacteria bacterium GW2011_GWE2_36_40]KKQ11743.1 MAG: Ribosomal large subunit pseudouridine synthase F [Candidatus Moranbacteria bacterium GW2011_GWE1_36_7]